jgi:hypothetical protein
MFSSEAARRLAVAWSILSLGLAACTSSSATLALRPDFDVRTPEGLASVSIREPWPGLTDAEFEHLVRTGMAAAMPGSVHIDVTPGAPPYPQRRIVWHVSPTPARGTSRLVVNIFAGSVPMTYELGVVDNSAPNVAITHTIESMTRRLLARYAQLDARPPAVRPGVAAMSVTRPSA